MAKRRRDLFSNGNKDNQIKPNQTDSPINVASDSTEDITSTNESNTTNSESVNDEESLMNGPANIEAIEGSTTKELSPETDILIPNDNDSEVKTPMAISSNDEGVIETPTVHLPIERDSESSNEDTSFIDNISCSENLNDVKNVDAQEIPTPKLEESVSEDKSSLNQTASIIGSDTSETENKVEKESSPSKENPAPTDASAKTEDSLDDASKNKRDSRKKIFTESSLAETIPAIAVVVSSVALILTTIKAMSFSLYYDIPLRELTNVTTAIEYIAEVLPMLLILLLILFPIKYVESSISSSSRGIIEKIGEITIIISFSIIDSIAISYYFFNCISVFIPVVEDKKTDSFVVGLILSGVILVFACVTYAFACINRKTNNKEKSSAEKAFVVSIVILYLVSVFLPAILHAYSVTLYPYSIKDYEIVSVNDIDYVVMCNNSSGKIIMECTITDDNKLIIDSSSYKYLQLENKEAQFEYVHFNSVMTKTEYESKNTNT